MRVNTPSTGSSPVEQPVYDVSIWLFRDRTKRVFRRTFPVCAARLRSQGQGVEMLLGRAVLSQCLLIVDGPGDRFTLAF